MDLLLPDDFFGLSPRAPTPSEVPDRGAAADWCAALALPEFPSLAPPTARRPTDLEWQPL